MHSHYGFHSEIAQDRQAQLFRDAGVDGPAAPHLAVMAANQQAEVAASRQRARPFKRAATLVVAWSEWRRLARVRPGLSGV
jgi:hypothetical protein